MPTVPFKVKAVFEYKSEEPDDLNFPNGQIITITDAEDADWYTGEYTSAAGDKLEGLFPRNFVEKYEPAIPSRPTRTPKKVAAPEPPPESAATQVGSSPPQPPESVKEAEIEPAQQPDEPAHVEEENNVPGSFPTAPQPATAVPAANPTSPPVAKAKPGPPPVADKPSSNSFKDRIAAFNKPAAPPVAPFKPGGQPGGSGFIKKPFVAPPPSKNSYVPPPREPAPQKLYRREEDTSLHHEEEREAPEVSKPTEEVDEDQPKPTSLKERIALLQKQQMEQAQRHAETGQKKEKPKKPPKRRPEPTEESLPAHEDNLERIETYETTVGRKSMDELEDDGESIKSPPMRQASLKMPTPLPPRELVSDTNDADDSGAGDTEDAPGTSTEEDRPRSKGIGMVGGLEPTPLKKETPVEAEKDEGEEGDEEETEEEEEDPEVRRKRELRERMARLGGGMGMMNMFGPPGGMPAVAPPRKSRPSTEATRQSSEQYHQEEMTRAPPVPIMALPGMSNQMPKRHEEPGEVESDEDETAQATPHETRMASDDYVSPLPPRRTSTGHSSASMPQDRAVPPPPLREVRAPPPPPPTETRGAPPVPQSPAVRSIPPPPPVKAPGQPAEESEDEDVAQPTPRSGDMPSSPIGAPPIPISKTRPDPVRPPAAPRDTPQSPASPQTRAPPPPPPGQPPSRKSTFDSHHMSGALGSRPDMGNDSDDEVTEYDGDYDTDIASSAKHKDALKSHNRDSSIDEGILTDDATKSPSSPPVRAVPPLPPVSAPRDVPPPPPPGGGKTRKSMDVPRAPPPIPPATQASLDDEEYDPYRYAAPQHGMPSPSIQQSPYAPVLQSPKEELEEEDMYGAAPQAPRMPPPPPSDRSAPPPPPNSTVPEPSKPSMDGRRSNTLPRRSMDPQRPSGEHGTIATDLDLGRSSFWWTQDNLLPPSLQQRHDIIFEMASSTSAKRGGKTMISKDVYVLYQDYSQTTINATFDASDPSQVNLEQSHERPPPAPRKDELESASEQFGAKIASAASSAAHNSTTMGDGSPHAFVLELLKPLSGALRPVSTRSYGALVYANLANASTQMFDVIRPGDIVTFRNAKFSGHKGTLNQKYTHEVGKPDHVAVVIDWDGTKKKIRAWEQVSKDKGGGKKAKVREESFKVGDLMSGEVRVWRVMGRGWVGWDKS